MDNIPKGLKLLRGPKRSFEVTVAVLDECCDEHTNRGAVCCANSEECNRIYEQRCEEWRLQKPRSKRVYRQPTDTERYANWMPTIAQRQIIRTIQERYVC